VDNTLILVLMVMLAGAVWTLGAFLQWSNIRRQERLVAGLRRLSLERLPRVDEPSPPVALEEVPAEGLRPARGWPSGW
jgi:hypothetical protein